MCFFFLNTSKFLKYSKNAPKWFPLSSFPFHSYLSNSLFHFPSPSLFIRDYTVGKTFHFHSTSLIGSKVTLYSFVFCFFFFFWMSDCLEMLVRVLGFRIVWLGRKYEKMKSVILKCFYRNYFQALIVLDLFFNRVVKSHFLVLLYLKLSFSILVHICNCSI